MTHTSDSPRGARVHLARALVLAALLAGAGRAFAQSPEPAAPDSSAAPAIAPAPAAPAPDAPGSRPVVGIAVKLVRSSGNVVRTGPGNGYGLVGTYPKGTTFPVITRSGDWYSVRVSDTESGWVHASLCREEQDLSGLQWRPNPKLYTRTGSYVLGGYSGAYAFDRKSNSLVAGGRLGYYVFDRIEAEAGVAWTHVHRPAEIEESLFALSLEAEDFHMLFYHLALTWELLPGRQMVPYVGAGVGSSIMLGRSEPSMDFGAGTRLFVSKRTAVRWEVRDFRFHTGTSSSRALHHNIEFTIGSEYLF
jgi:outer membrane beta-barrel protein